MQGRSIHTMVPIASAIAAVSLLLPWSRSGGNDRSSIEVLRTAGVLDLVSGTTRWLLSGAWYVVVTLAAGSIIAWGWRRQRAAAWLGLPIGLAMVIAAITVARSPLPLRWGAIVGCVAGLTATVGSGVVLIQDGLRAEGRTR